MTLIAGNRWTAVGLKSPSVRSMAHNFIGFIALFIIYIVSAYIISEIYNFKLKFSIYNRSSTMFILFAVLYLQCYMFYSIVKNKPEKPFRYVIENFLGNWNVLGRFAYGLPYLIALTIFFSVFSSVKNGISKIVPFYFDPYAMKIDRVIHGIDPWRISHDIFGSPVSIFIISTIYNLWVVVTFGTIAFAMFAVRDERLRARFAISLLLSWAILGSVFATAFASVGPCYYELFYADPYFQELIRALDVASQAYPIATRSTQDYLYVTFSNTEPGLGTGISAFPSMHVSAATLTCLLAWQFGPVWRAAGLLFVAAILIGSVHLGWHYAIDGYASILAVLAIWFLVGKLLRADISRENKALSVGGPATDNAELR
jgi:hypothetical protein